VIGVDASPTLVARASAAGGADYRVGDASALPVGDAEVDLVVAFLVFQDFDDLAGALMESSRVLAPLGRLCFTIVHPIAEAGGFSPAGDFVLGSYCTPFETERPLAGRSVTHYHRPLETYSRALEQTGFVLEAIRELPARDREIPAFLHARVAKRN
jgi:SAM-dependent methyltransferase